MIDKIKKEQRLGEERLNKQGSLMKIIEYNKSDDIVIEFQDEYKTRVHTKYSLFKIGQIRNPFHYSFRIGEEQLNKQGYMMKIVKYNDSHNIIVEFQDRYKAKVHTTYRLFKIGEIDNPSHYFYRIGEEKLNNQGCLMKIIEYNDSYNILVEFQDKYKTKIKATYYNFKNGAITNPYHPSVYGIGMIGNKYPTSINNKTMKEYTAWQDVLRRSFHEKTKEKRPTYKDVTCCEEWLFYENFYEWIHSQENFDKWHDNKKWHIDKDILVKGNKIYSPETCCLVPEYINTLFVKNDKDRGGLPIGVTIDKRRKEKEFVVQFGRERKHLGYYGTPEEAFKVYKKTKESYIKQVAQEEYDKGNITKQCYEAMMKYEVEITD